MCDCNKVQPQGRANPQANAQRQSLVASLGSAPTTGITHIAADGTRTVYSDLIGARAAVIRQGGTISNS